MHDAVPQISGKDVAAEPLRRLDGKMVRHQFQLSLRPGRPAGSMRQHLAIIDAIDNGDPDAAAHTVEEHLAIVIVALRTT
jgi:DNA-binding FadR family transcriptional regulator